MVSPSDRHHGPASYVAHQLVRERELIWTIDAVIVELWRLLRGEFGREKADLLVRGLASGGLDIQPSARDDYAQAWQRAVDWPDQDFAFTDRLSFAAIERLHSYRAWSYEVDFAIIRVGAARNRALDILR